MAELLVNYPNCKVKDSYQAAGLGRHVTCQRERCQGVRMVPQAVEARHTAHFLVSRTHYVTLTENMFNKVETVPAEHTPTVANDFRHTTSSWEGIHRSSYVTRRTCSGIFDLVATKFFIISSVLAFPTESENLALSSFT